MYRTVARSHVLNAIGEPSRAHLKSDIPLLKRRGVLLNKALLFSTIRAITTSVLVIVAFVSAYLNFAHECGVAVLFVLAVAFFTASLVNPTRDFHCTSEYRPRCALARFSLKLAGRTGP